MEAFTPAARDWFETRFGAPTPVQREGWRRIAEGHHALLLAPTGSGKTLAAFFHCIDRLGLRDPAPAPGVRVLYVSPLKALVYDIERNLRAPLAGIRHAAEARGQGFRPPRVAVRTGDTPAGERRKQGRDPAEILVTTPESLYLILGSRQAETLAGLETVIVDELHALAPSKRGAHLALSLERVSALCRRDPQRIGLSATAQPADEVARYLGGDRPVSVVDAAEPPRLDLTISVPVPDLTRPGDARSGAAGEEAGAGLWPALIPKLLEQIRAHRSSIVFVNSRGLCERLSQQLNELAGEEIARAHHGSLAHPQRRQIEELLKTGALRAIVATSSLELGIDMQAVDLVMLVESPGAVTRGLQRVGRAGHRVGERSRGLVFPKHRGDLLEATVVAAGMTRGAVEAIRLPQNPLDVLAQQIVALGSTGRWGVAALEALVRRAASFRELSREQLCGVLDMLAGRYPSTDFAELRPRLVWDRDADTVEARRGARQLALVSGGTIPDRGQYAVHLGPDGPRLGELDEEMVHETRAGETLTLGASSWRVVEITRDRVIVAPAPGEVGKLPFWRGEGPGRPLELGRALGAFVRELGARCLGSDAARRDAESWLRAEHGLDAFAAANLVSYLVEQHEATGCLPTDRSLTIERFRDELGDWRVCLLSPFGARVHAPWALAVEATLSQAAGSALQVLWSDDGIALRFADTEEPPAPERLIPDPAAVQEQIVEQLDRTALFAGQFRENAARALLLPRRRPGSRTPLWSQRLRAQSLLAVARQYPSFPIMLETYRSCLQDVFDLPGLLDLLDRIRRGELRVDAVETRSASPFARSLVFAYTAAYLYQGDSPLAERRAQALSLDRHMLRDLLGQEELRELLDPGVVDATEAELQGRAAGRRARGADALHDLLRRLGDLSEPELSERSEGDPADRLAQLERSGRARQLAIGAEARWVAAEDVALYRDALGVAPPPGLPAALLEPVARPMEQLLLRFARGRGPFLTRDVAERYALLPAQVEAILSGLEARGALCCGDFHPRGHEREWCEPEVLRRLRRRTLARLRSEVAPVEGRVLGRFLPLWHGIGQKGEGEARLDEVLARLEGLPLSFAELERVILPSRVPDFDPRRLDERGALGQWVWVGCGALGERDGRIALYRRDRIAWLAEAPQPAPELAPLPRALLQHLAQRGASFGVELAAAAGSPSQRELQGALWELVWRGLVTNDTFAPLRALTARRRSTSPRGRGGRAAESRAAAGRWALVQGLLADPPEPTQRAHARALLLLERYGVLSRDALAAEAIPGGFAGVYPVLRAMEEAGKLRRGHFVAGLAGAQFAFAGAVDRLRAARAGTLQPSALALAASDPANPYGSLLPWPETRQPALRPRRAVGATVVLVDGEPAVYLEGGGRRLLTFPSGPDALERALGALGAACSGRRRRSLWVAEIDGEPALASPLAAILERAGFRADYRGLVLERPLAGV